MTLKIILTLRLYDGVNNDDILWRIGDINAEVAWNWSTFINIEATHRHPSDIGEEDRVLEQRNGNWKWCVPTTGDYYTPETHITIIDGYHRLMETNRNIYQKH